MSKILLPNNWDKILRYFKTKSSNLSYLLFLIHCWCDRTIQTSSDRVCSGLVIIALLILAWPPVSHRWSNDGCCCSHIPEACPCQIPDWHRLVWRWPLQYPDNDTSTYRGGIKTCLEVLVVLGCWYLMRVLILIYYNIDLYYENQKK